MDESPEQVTQILEAVGAGDAQAAEKLLPLVYEELRKLAAHRMAREAPGQTLQPTALVHEAWLRLVGKTDPQFHSRAHFFAAAAEAMRRILVEHARRKARLKRGGEWERVRLDEVQLAEECDPETVLRVDSALENLAKDHPEKAELVKLRFFVGLSLPEAARVLNISGTTAKRYWAFARAWLYGEMTGDD
jgi:RNA polymerase sigma factor (TIGR02999 family)